MWKISKKNCQNFESSLRVSWASRSILRVVLSKSHTVAKKTISDNPWLGDVWHIRSVATRPEPAFPKWMGCYTHVMGITWHWQKALPAQKRQNTGRFFTLSIWRFLADFFSRKNIINWYAKRVFDSPCFFPWGISVILLCGPGSWCTCSIVLALI